MYKPLVIVRTYRKHFSAKLSTSGLNGAGGDGQSGARYSVIMVSCGPAWSSGGGEAVRGCCLEVPVSCSCPETSGHEWLSNSVAASSESLTFM